MKNETDLLLVFVQEHWEEMRHVENQRSTIANLILIIAAGTIAFIAQKGFGSASFLLSLLLFFLGLYGTLATLKLYERYNHSQNRLNCWYKKLDEMNPQAEFLSIRTRADEAHEVKFPRMSKIRVHRLWMTFHVVIGLLGLIFIPFSLAAMREFRPNNQDAESKITPPTNSTNTRKNIRSFTNMNKSKYSLESKNTKIEKD